MKGRRYLFFFKYIYANRNRFSKHRYTEHPLRNLRFGSTHRELP